MVTRRQFLAQSFGLTVIAGSLGAWLTSCGGSELASEAVSGGDCQSNGTSVLVSSNHGHTASAIPGAHVATGAQRTYTLTAGTAGHTHTYSVSAQAFNTLKENQGVVVTTDTDNSGHTHTVTINCA